MDEFGRTREDEWFRENERKLLEDARRAREKREAERRAQESAEERRKRKELHWMKCPKCGHELAVEALDGVEIDRCSFCEGVFMDAGELEKLFLQRTQQQRRSVLRRLVGL
ncbi:MAG: zf-TFIIB domain-containing protein [Betaproteobacteria bacterium]